MMSIKYNNNYKIIINNTHYSQIELRVSISALLNSKPKISKSLKSWLSFVELTAIVQSC